MGEPNNQLQEVTDLLRFYVLDPEHYRLPLKLAHQYGFDVDMVEVMYEEDVKPYLKNLLGYKSLAESDPDIGHGGYHQRHLSAGTLSWEDVLKANHIKGKYNQLFEVFKGDFEDSAARHRDRYSLRIAAFLSREGDWLIWTRFGGPAGQPPEQIAVCKTIREAIDLIESQIAELNSATDILNRKPDNVAMKISEALVSKLLSTLEDKELQRSSLERASNDARSLRKSFA